MKYTTLRYKLEKPRNGDAGYDLRVLEDHCIFPGMQFFAETGIAVEIPDGYVGLVLDRSSLAQKMLHNHGGVIDSSYRGTIKIILYNDGNMPYMVKAGDKVAQLVIVKCFVDDLELCERLSQTDRGINGFGSTGA